MDISDTIKQVRPFPEIGEVVDYIYSRFPEPFGSLFEEERRKQHLEKEPIIVMIREKDGLDEVGTWRKILKTLLPQLAHVTGGPEDYEIRFRPAAFASERLFKVAAKHELAHIRYGQGGPSLLRELRVRMYCWRDIFYS